MTRRKRILNRTFETRKTRIGGVGFLTKRKINTGIPKLITGAERLLAQLKESPDNKTRVIFIGQQMRPFFDVVRALNERDRILPRDSIKYFVTPSSDIQAQVRNGGHARPAIQEQVTTHADLVSHVSNRLHGKKIVSKKWTHYHIFDVKDQGKTFGLVRSAIKRIDPDARVISGGTGTHAYDETFANLEGKRWVFTPTQKSTLGDSISPRTNKAHVTPYLYFQQQLQEHLNKTREKN